LRNTPIRLLWSDRNSGLSNSAVVSTGSGGTGDVAFSSRTRSTAALVTSGSLTSSCSVFFRFFTRSSVGPSGASSIARRPVSRYLARSWRKFDRLSVIAEHSSEVVANMRTSPMAVPSSGDPSIAAL
jgi:hypothetical protein